MEAGERREATPHLGPGCGWKRSRCLGSPDSPGEQGPREESCLDSFHLYSAPAEDPTSPAAGTRSPRLWNGEGPAAAPIRHGPGCWVRASLWARLRL